MHKLLILTTAILSSGCFQIAHAEVYHCKEPNGSMIYQDQPCDNDTVKVIGTNTNSSSLSSQKMLEVLAKMSGKSVDQMQDPKYRQAAEALVVTDAGKAHAFTKIHAASAPFCDSSVSSALTKYQSLASDAIDLGRHYYTNGIDLRVGEKSFKHSGGELTAALNQEISKKVAEFENMNKSQINSMCNETAEALETLSQVYANQ